MNSEFSDYPREKLMLWLLMALSKVTAWLVVAGCAVTLCAAEWASWVAFDLVVAK